MSRTKRERPKAPPRNYISYFTLGQEIGLRLQRYGRRIGKMATLAPVFSADIVDDLRYLRDFCEVAIGAVEQAQREWE